MNEFMSDREGDELSAKLKNSFSNLHFDKPSPSRKSQMRRQSRIAAAGLAGVAILAVGSLVPGGTSKTWANEPTILSTSDRQFIAEICGDMGRSIQSGDSYIFDFRGGYGFYLYDNQLNNSKLACTFTQKKGKFEALSVLATTGYGNDSDIDSSIIETSAPVSTWHGESIVVVSGTLSDGATVVELRSNEYPTWKPLVTGNKWTMLIPSNLKGTLVELDSSGNVIFEKPFSFQK